MHMNETRRNRLQLLISESGLNDKEFAARIHSSPAYLSQIKSGYRPIGEKKARSIESAMRKPRYWLDDADKVSSIDMEPLPMDYVPLISWVQAGGWSEAIDNNEPGMGYDMIPCVKKHSSYTYALIVEGDSMTSSGARSFPQGTKIIVDPDQGANSGDFVIAKINGDNAVTFKQLMSDGGRSFLKPLNPQYPIITDEFRVIGKVIQAVQDL